jgi:hypothetical protein
MYCTVFSHHVNWTKLFAAYGVGFQFGNTMLSFLHFASHVETFYTINRTARIPLLPVRLTI